MIDITLRGTYPIGLSLDFLYVETVFSSRRRRRRRRRMRKKMRKRIKRRIRRRRKLICKWINDN